MSLCVSQAKPRPPDQDPSSPLASPALLEASLHFSAVGLGEVKRSTLNMTLQKAFLLSSRSTAFLNTLLFVPLFI